MFADFTDFKICAKIKYSRKLSVIQQSLGYLKNPFIPIIYIKAIYIMEKLRGLTMNIFRREDVTLSVVILVLMMLDSLMYLMVMNRHYRRPSLQSDPSL